jgi:hypothetical protein
MSNVNFHSHGMTGGNEMSATASCPKCSALLDPAQEYTWCVKCGEPLPETILDQLPRVVASRQALASNRDQAPANAAISSNGGLSREGSIALTVGGLVVLLVGVLRWNSIASQWMRANGDTDGLGLSLMLLGALMLITGLIHFSNTQTSSKPEEPVRSTGVDTSVEGRLRQLEQLRSSALITDSEYAERRRAILTSL